MDNLRYEDPSGILFNKVKAPLTLFEKGPLGKKDRISINGADVTDIDLEKAFVNAVDIDWNGAEVDSNTEINTTGELLAWIKSKIGSGEDTPEELPITVSFTFNCYRWYLSDIELPQAPLDSDEDEPSPSDYIGDSSKALPTNKWSKYSTNRPDVGWYLWLSSTIRTLNVSDGTITTGNWSTPVRISGLDGTPGEDSTLEEWIYKVYTTELDFSTNGDNPASWEIVDLDDYTGTWSDNPPGVSINFPFEYKSFRKKLNGHWGKFSGPVLNGHYGINGNDGDGVEYVFARTTKDFPPIIKNDPYNTDKLSYNVDEFLPLVYVNNSDNRVSGSQFGDTGNVEDKCTDNPVGVNSVWKYEWVLKRKKTSNDHDGNREWEPYTGNLNPETGEGYMAKWATFSQNGIDGDTPIIEIIDGYWFINGTNTGVKAEGSDGSSGVLVVDYCPDGADEYPIGTMANCQGHIKLKIASGWIDLGESSGTGSYTHIAYATWVTISNGVVTDVTGFTVSNANGISYPWVGFYSNDEETDPGADASSDLDKLNAAKLYKWNYVKGMDGNGVEWIYTMSKGTKPTINLDSGQGTKTEDEFLPLVANYQANQFWSLYWSDDPPAQVSPEWPNRWKAQRKKVNGVWSTFGNVVDDGTYTVAESVYTITSDNDVFILDDLTVDSATIIESSRANVGLSYGTVPYNGNYTLELPNNLLNLPNGLTVMFNPNNNRQLYVTVENGANLSILPVGAYYYYVQAVVDNVIVALRRFNFYIKNITADGSVYKLVILNDSLSFTGEGTRISTEAPKAIILKIKNGVPQNISNENLTLYSGNSLPQSNIPSGLILLYPSSMSTSGNIITTNTSKLLNFNPINYSAGGYELTLYYGLTEGNTIIPVIVDSEHIDCLKDGTDGKDGVVSGYTLNCDNDNVIVDDNTVSGFNILAKSLLTLKTTEEQFPNNISLEIDTSGISFVKTSNETKSGAIFQISASPVGNTQTNTSREYLIEFTSIQNPLPSTLTLGSYSIIYKAVDGSNNVLILKKQNIHVDDFSMGESYKLVVTPNSISCDSEGNIKSDSLAPNISYLKINGADSVEQITNPTNSSSVNVGNLYIGITPDNDRYIYRNGEITFSDSIDSTISKLTVNLYLKISSNNSIIVDSEDIDIIRDGANGTGGRFRSTVFCRTNDPLNTLLVNSQTGKSTIAGGTYTNPIPNNTLYRYSLQNKSISWEDGVPPGTDLLWSTSAIFEDVNNFTPEWSVPAMQADSDVLDIEFSPNENYNPLGDTPYEDRSNRGWYDPSKHTNVDWSTMIWRAERKVKNGVFIGDWVITRIKGERGNDGTNGTNGLNGLDAENQWTIWAEPNIIVLNLLVDGNGFVPVNITIYAKKGNAVATLKLNTNVQVTPTNVTSSNINRNTFRITGATLNLSTYSVSVSGTWIDPENSTTEKPLSIVIPVQLNLLNEVKNLVIQYIGNDVVSTVVESSLFRTAVNDEVNNNISELNADINSLEQRANSLDSSIATVQTDLRTVTTNASTALQTANRVETKVANLEGSNGRNLFGFSKGITFTNCYPIIMDYGFLIITLNSTVTALLGNLGLNGTGGLFVVSFEVLSEGGNQEIKIGFNSSSYLSTVTGAAATWTKKVIYFNDISDSDAALDKLYIRIGSSEDLIAFKNFLIERGNIVTPFGISLKDAMNYGSNNLISLGNESGLDVINQKTYDYYSFNSNEVINLSNLKYRVPYTLSFYAKLNNYSSSPEYSLSSGNDTYLDLYSDSLTERVSKAISTSWKKYYIYWYIDNPNFVLNTNDPKLTLFYGTSSSNKVKYADVKFQEGYIYEGNETGNSIIRQTADEILLKVANTGIDITNGKISATGELFEWLGSDGPILQLKDNIAEFSGKIKSTRGIYLKYNRIKCEGLSNGSHNILDVMFNPDGILPDILVITSTNQRPDSGFPRYLTLPPALDWEGRIIDIYVLKVYKKENNLGVVNYGDIITLGAYSGSFIDILDSVNNNKDIKEKYSTIPTINYIPNIGTWHVKLYAMNVGTTATPTGKWLVIEMNDCMFVE